jgi:hypothetical protein
MTGVEVLTKGDTMRRWMGIGLVMLLGAGALVALVSNGRGTDGAKAVGSASTARRRTAQADFGGSNTAARFAIKQDSIASTSGSSAAKPAVPAPVPVNPGVPKVGARVVKHATLELMVRRGALRSKFATANGVAGFFGGFVESSDESHGLATITLRVPSDRFEEALQQLSGLGRVSNRSERGDDVTAQFTDIDARLRNLTAQEGVLQDLMRQARNIPDTIAVQQQLSTVREQIEQLTGQRNVLDDQASFATVAVTMRAVGVATTSAAGRGSLAQAWHDAIGVTVAIIGGTIVVLGAVIPLGALVLVGLLVWMLIRRRRPQATPAGV